MAKPDEEIAGIEAINKLKSTDLPLFLSPNSDLSCFSRIASQHLFASLKPYSPKSPFEQLLSDGFDAEQIWQQIDLQSQPLITSLKREIKRFEKNPDQILNLFGISEANGMLERKIKENGEVGLEEYGKEFEGFSDQDEDEDEMEAKMMMKVGRIVVAGGGSRPAMFGVAGSRVGLQRFMILRGMSQVVGEDH